MTCRSKSVNDTLALATALHIGEDDRRVSPLIWVLDSNESSVEWIRTKAFLLKGLLSHCDMHLHANTHTYPPSVCSCVFTFFSNSFSPGNLVQQERVWRTDSVLIQWTGCCLLWHLSLQWLCLCDCHIGLLAYPRLAGVFCSYRTKGLLQI